MKLSLQTLVCLLLISHSLNSYCAIRRICKVRYETEYGWSKEYKSEVTFMTGNELNKTTNSFKYSSFSNYCLIWFDNDEVALLEIKDFLSPTGEEFDRDDFLNAFQIRSDISCSQVNNEVKTRWKIIARESVYFIDPRESR